MNGSTSTMTTIDVDPPPPELKRCKLCGQEKPLDQFGAKPTGKGGKRNQCNDCRAIYERSPYKNAATAIAELPKVNWPSDPAGRLALAVDLRMKLYKESAIDAVFDLAMMAVGTNPLLMQVKLAAAKLLSGPLPGDAPAERSTVGPDADPFLKQLAEAFNAQAPRLREIRERVAVFDTQPETLPPDTIQ